MNNKNILLFIVAMFFSLSCDKNNPSDGGKPPCGGIDPYIIPESPYNNPIWHPSGQFIGFNHVPLKRITYPYGEKCWGRQELNYDSSGFWLINFDGTNMRRIFPYTLQTPVWSPDGEWIAFDSNNESPNGMNFIWTMKFDGTRKRRIVYEPSMGEIRMPNWFPDGKKIAHQRYIGIGAPEIFVMDSSGQNPVRLTYTERFDSHPKYSPDRTRIAFWSSGNVWIMDSTGSNLRQLTTTGVDVDFGLPFSWSPVGDKIIYTRYQSTDWTMKNGVLWMIDVNARAETQFTFNP